MTVTLTEQRDDQYNDTEGFTVSVVTATDSIMKERYSRFLKETRIFASLCVPSWLPQIQH